MVGLLGLLGCWGREGTTTDSAARNTHVTVAHVTIGGGGLGTHSRSQRVTVVAEQPVPPPRARALDGGRAGAYVLGDGAGVGADVGT